MSRGQVAALALAIGGLGLVWFMSVDPAPDTRQGTVTPAGPRRSGTMVDAARAATTTPPPSEPRSTLASHVAAIDRQRTRLLTARDQIGTQLHRAKDHGVPPTTLQALDRHLVRLDAALASLPPSPTPNE